MTINDKINDLEILKAEIEWDFDLRYQTLIEEVIKDLNKLRRLEREMEIKNETN